jgi:hypothetical protein
MSHYAALPRAVALALPMTFGTWTVQAADIIETAEQVGRFDGFLHLLEAADMVDTLRVRGPLPFLPRSMKHLASCPRARSTGFWLRRAGSHSKR